MMGDADDAKDDEGFPPPELTALCVCVSVCWFQSELTGGSVESVRTSWDTGHHKT